MFTQPGPAGATGHRRDQVIYYQYRAERARRTLRGIDEQVATAEKAVAGKTPVKRNRFIRLSGGTNSVSRLRQLVEHAPLPVSRRRCACGTWNVSTASSPGRRHAALAYRFWHPRDHIFFQRRGTFGPGDRWHIVVAFGADRRFLYDQVFDVTRLDETGFTMEVRRLGYLVVVADERWRPIAAGLCWTVEMTVGSPEPGLRTIVRAVVRRRMAFLQRWRQHNVEEAGNLPYFLPELYAGDAGS